MKHILALFLLTAFAISASARMDGWYMHEITRDVKTPSQPWLEKDPETLKVLFFSPGTHGRYLVEIAQRMNIDYTPFIGPPSGSTSHESAVVVGTTPAECAVRLRQCMDKKYDVAVLYATSLSQFPAETRYELLDRVRKGELNLVIIEHDWQIGMYKKLLADQIASPSFIHQYSDAQPPPSPALKDKAAQDAQAAFAIDTATLSKNGIQCFTFGKGRIVKLDNKVLNDFDAGNAARFETRMAVVLQAVRWAAKGDAPLSFSAPDLENNPKLPMNARDIQFYLSGSGLDQDVTGEVRIRNEFNEVEAVLPLTAKNGFRLSLPGMASGQYFADVRFFDGKKVLAHGVYRFELTSPLGNVSIGCNDLMENGKVPEGFVQIPAPSQEPLTLRLRMKDMPYGHVWSRMELPVPEKAHDVKFKFENCYNPTLAGTLLAELVNAKGEILSRATKKIFFPNRNPGDYLIFAWGGPYNSRNEAMRLAELFGFSATINLTLTEYNYRPIPGFSHITIGTNKDNQSTTDIGWGGTPKYDDNIYNPEVRRKIAEEGAAFMRSEDWRKKSAIIFNLGDENALSLTAGYGPNDTKYFRDMLKAKYQTVDMLNKQWNTKYGSFDEVPNAPHMESLTQGNFAAWNDHCEYIEKTYADWNTARAMEIKKVIPDAIVGAEGSHSGDLERTIEHLGFWGPYGDGEEVRAFSGNRVRTSWYGYHGERASAQAGGYPWVIPSIFKGVATGMGWFTCEYAGGSYSILASDLRSAYEPHFVDALNQLRFGFGQILAVNPFAPSGIMLFSSHLSDRASAISKSCVHPGDSRGVLIDYFYRTGRSFNMASERTLERINNQDVKILFLTGSSVLSEKAVKKITEFVQNGGVVVADMNPGMFNEYMRRMETNVAPELFGKDVVYQPGVMPVVQPMELKTSLNGVDLALKAKYAKQKAGAPLFQVREVGKGKVVLLNFTLTPADTSCSDDASMDDFLHNLLRAANEPDTLSIQVPLDRYIVRVRRGRDFDLVGILGFDKAVFDSVKGTITLPAAKYVYKCKTGFVGHTNVIPVEFNKKNAKKPLDKFPLQLFATFDREQTAPELTVPAELNAGDVMSLDFAKIPKGRILLLRVFNPEGEEQLIRNQVLNTEKLPGFDFHFAYDDPKGNWKFILSDVATGLEKPFTVRVK